MTSYRKIYITLNIEKKNNNNIGLKYGWAWKPNFRDVE
jgi:hypothetical protein